MAREAAKQFLELFEKSAELQDKVRELDAEQTVAFAKENGFDITLEELEEALQEIRAVRKQNSSELNLDEMDKVTGGAFWTDEYSKDGYEFGCVLSYYFYKDQVKKDEWCERSYYCKQSHHMHESKSRHKK